MGCDSTLSLSFDSPIGQLGDYVFVLGEYRFTATVPSAFPSGVQIQNFQVVGIEAHVSNPSRSLRVQIWKDGGQIVDGDAILAEYTNSEFCGVRCGRASFHMPVPASLARTWGPCDRTQLTGQYSVKESPTSGGCAKVFTTTTLEFDNGLLRMKDATCKSSLGQWSPDTCTIQSTTTCTSDTSDVTWTLALTDAIGDGSRLVGTAGVAATSPVACQSSAGLDLNRQ